MVIPAEIFHVLHAQSLRTFLTEKCSQILLFDPEEIWFENTLQGAVILLAEKKETPSQKFRGVGIIPTKTRSFLNNEASGYFANADFTNGETVSGKWMLALLSKHERSILSKARKNQFIHPFTDLASVAVGIVTGANKFFLVADETVEKYDLGAWAHPMFGRSEHVPGVVYNEQVHTLNKDRGVPTNFLWFEDTPVAELSKDAQEYIHFGESQLLHTRYKCRIRQPWYSVPSVYSTSIGMLKRSHHFPRLILNEIEAYTTDTAYRIQPKGIKNEQLVSCFVNSLTALSAELEGRHYGGGVLELVPSEIRKILIPNVVTAKESVYHLDHLFRQGMAHEEILTIQDATILKAAGFSEEERFSILAAWLRLNRRRQRISD